MNKCHQSIVKSVNILLYLQKRQFVKASKETCMSIKSILQRQYRNRDDTEPSVDRLEGKNIMRVVISSACLTMYDYTLILIVIEQARIGDKYRYIVMMKTYDHVAILTVVAMQLVLVC